MPRPLHAHTASGPLAPCGRHLLVAPLACRPGVRRRRARACRRIRRHLPFTVLSPVPSLVPTFRRARPVAANSSVALLLGAAALGCSRGESRPVHAADTGAPTGRATDRSLARGDVVPLAGDVVPPGVRATAPAYQVVPVPNAGSVTGAVVLDGAPPRDTTVTPDSADRRACGTSLVDRTLEVDREGGVRGAVVWLEGVAAGKPMPAARRHELALDGCRLVPRLLPVTAGGTLNVHGVDALESRLRFARAAGSVNPGRVLLRTTMTGAGQVVPDAQVLAAAGAVEVQGEQRPWLRAWVLAFDHPYFAATGASGAFTLGDVPPGAYRLVVWHDRLGRVEQPVTVGAGQAAAVTVRMQSPEAPAATAADGR